MRHQRTGLRERHPEVPHPDLVVCGRDGRTSGAQISIVTKSGTNPVPSAPRLIIYGTISSTRNDFDASPLPKPPLRHNDFGGTVGGPIIKGKALFFAYEGLGLRLPRTATGDFLTVSARAAVAPVYQAILRRCLFPIRIHPIWRSRSDSTCRDFLGDFYCRQGQAHDER
jgi:hypothetical protein